MSQIQTPKRTESGMNRRKKSLLRISGTQDSSQPCTIPWAKATRLSWSQCRVRSMDDCIWLVSFCTLGLSCCLHRRIIKWGRLRARKWRIVRFWWGIWQWVRSGSKGSFWSRLGWRLTRGAIRVICLTSSMRRKRMSFYQEWRKWDSRRSKLWCRRMCLNRLRQLSCYGRDSFSPILIMFSCWTVLQVVPSMIFPHTPSFLGSVPSSETTVLTVRTFETSPFPQQLLVRTKDQ